MHFRPRAMRNAAAGLAVVACAACDAATIDPDIDIAPDGGACACEVGALCEDETGACVTEAYVWVPMRDGARLRTRIILPSSGRTPVPTLLLRTPYGAFESSVLPAFRPFTELGYAFVYQRVRGTQGSEGHLRPLAQEFADGHDAVEWIARQPWSNGRIGTLGGSYEGFAAFAAAVDTPAVKVVIADGHSARGFESFPATHGGALSWDFLWWDRYVTTGEDWFADLDNLTIASNHRPARDVDLALSGAHDPIWRAALPHLEARDTYWNDFDIVDKFDRICVPTLHLMAATEGLAGPLDGFLNARAASCPDEVRTAQRFVLGSHRHTGAVTSPFGPGPASVLIRRYVDHYLGGVPDPTLVDIPPVQYFVQNADVWGDATEWPATTRSREFFLHASATPTHTPRLLESLPARIAEETYAFDPEHDDPCNGPLEGLTYESDPLAEAMDVVGAPRLILYGTVDAPDADVFAYLEEVRSADDATLITLASMRLRFRVSMANPTLLTPGEPFAAELTFLPQAYRVAAGARLRLTLTSAECGILENPGTGGSIIEDVTTRPARMSVRSSNASASRIVLPVL